MVNRGRTFQDQIFMHEPAAFLAERRFNYSRQAIYLVHYYTRGYLCTRFRAENTVSRLDSTR